MQIFYPEIKPYQRHQIAVEPPHELYVDESGNPDGIPVLFVHGGPGAGCGKYDRRFFDPEVYRIVLFDQRGAGRSRPHAELDNNTTQKLVDDIEVIRKTLGIEKWVLFGGSWGSTLSLVYAQTYPERVLGLILRGIFLCRQEDIHWFYQEGANRLFPDYWEDFVDQIPADERNNILAAYYHRLIGENQIQQMSAAKAWAGWEGRTATLKPCQDVVDSFTEPHRALSLARIEAHYFMNNSFLEPNQILRDAHKLAGIPGVIVHGRYDVICPLDNAYALHQAWPDSELIIIREAGHASREPGIVDALIRATDDMAKTLLNTGDQLA
ncbi:MULTISPECIES: prolyl aminopeptidase [unclassified Cellvibrio]|uniref:prolyl aminopeptidase n=1 Tax=unclassified Cellvibrio TaxID=2624793 RepID=UPI00066FC8A8|nr:prolyl aminopeptidase [Cellvibrio sp. pealriver]